MDTTLIDTIPAVIDTVTAVVADPEVVLDAVEEGSAVWNFIVRNIGELAIGLLAFIKIIVNLTPTEDDNKVFGWLDALINMIIADRKKGLIMPGKHYKLGGAIKRRAEQMRNNPANPTSKRMKTKDASGKTKTGGILGQNKEKRTVSNPFGRDKSATVKTKRRFGRTVETTRTPLESQRP